MQLVESAIRHQKFQKLSFFCIIYHLQGEDQTWSIIQLIQLSHQYSSRYGLSKFELKFSLTRQILQQPPKILAFHIFAFDVIWQRWMSIEWLWFAYGPTPLDSWDIWSVKSSFAPWTSSIWMKVFLIPHSIRNFFNRREFTKIWSPSKISRFFSFRKSLESLWRCWLNLDACKKSQATLWEYIRQK